MKNNPALEQSGHFDQKANEPSVLRGNGGQLVLVIFAATTSKY